MWTNGVKVLKDDKSGFIVTDQ
uniref:Elongation factor P n=1 Tax=Meloidogyne hapla TaxID=6305 RepID=A0A1I8BCC0_MELHA